MIKCPNCGTKLVDQMTVAELSNLIGDLLGLENKKQRHDGSYYYEGLTMSKKKMVEIYYKVMEIKGRDNA